MSKAAPNNLTCDMSRLRARLAVDEALQHCLGPIEDDAAFLDALADVAGALDFRLSPDRLKAQMRADPEGPGRLAPPHEIADVRPSAAWLPVDVCATADGRRAVGWAYAGRRRLVEPFFEDSARVLQRRPFNRFCKLWTPLDGFLRAPESSAPEPTCLEPTGFIFHMSRCGSTLAAQMLAASPANVVISEAPPIDAVVQMAADAPNRAAAEAAALLKAMVGAYGQRRSGEERRFFIKLDSWHTLAMPLFRMAFPSTPWIFLYRDPVEVMVSQVRQRGVQMVPAFVPPKLYGLEAADWTRTESYCAQVLKAVCDPVPAAYAGGGGRLVNYDQMPQAVFDTVLPHFGVACSGEERAQMDAAAQVDAKAPSFAFSSDMDSKQAAATPAILTACSAYLDPVYRRLEDLRRSVGCEAALS